MSIDRSAGQQVEVNVTETAKATAEYSWMTRKRGRKSRFPTHVVNMFRSWLAEHINSPYPSGNSLLASADLNFNRGTERRVE